MQSHFKDYFTFTKKERTGIYVLLVLIAIGGCIPWFFSTPSISEAVQAEVVHLQRSPPPTVKNEYNKQQHYKPRPASGYEEPKTPATYFNFDPNTLPAAGWQKLGVSDRSIRTIQNYLSKGGRFRQAADLQKIYGLKAADAARLIPYVHITAPAPVYNREAPPTKFTKPPPTIFDVNAADTAAFISLPGIGSKLATRIVHFRNKLGGFHSVEQVAETFGLPDSTFQLIKPRLQCAGTALQKLNINTADAATLKQHPYIRWNIANAIVQYRQQHGAFRSTEALQQIVLITPELYQKIAVYVTVE